MLCQTCSHQPACLVYQLAQGDQRLLLWLKKLKHCELRQPALSS